MHLLSCSSGCAAAKTLYNSNRSVGEGLDRVSSRSREVQMTPRTLGGHMARAERRANRLSGCRRNFSAREPRAGALPEPGTPLGLGQARPRPAARWPTTLAMLSNRRLSGGKSFCRDPGCALGVLWAVRLRYFLYIFSPRTTTRFPRRQRHPGNVEFAGHYLAIFQKRS